METNEIFSQLAPALSFTPNFKDNVVQLTDKDDEE